jgi:hypothetical protein
MKTTFRCAIALAVLGAWLRVQAQSAAQSVTSRVEEVVIVFKTHFDIGYTDMASNVVRRYRTTMMDEALKVVDQSRGLPAAQQFAWTLPGWPLSKIMEDWPGQTPERQQRVQRAFKEGRFVVHALPFTTHTELLEPEDLVRGLAFASRLSRAASLELPRDAKMTDVPCHSWILPTLLRQAGVDFLHLGCNAASSSPRVPRLFFWEGPDGSRLLTMYTAESYGTGLVPPRDWPFQTWLALIHTGDNHGPPTPAEVKTLLDEAKVKLPGVKVRIGRLSDFADGILAEKAKLSVVRGDMPDTWIHGPMSDPQGAKLARNIRPALAVAESLNTMLGAWAVKTPDAAPTLAQAYEQSLLYGEHTWGGAQYWVTKYGAGTKWSYGEGWKADKAAGRFQRLEDSWAEHTAYIQTAARLAVPILTNQLAALAQAMAESGPRVVVFNPLPWKRNGLAEVALPPKHEPAFAFRPFAGGPDLPAAYTGPNRLAWVAAHVPAMGTTAGRPVSSGSDSDSSPSLDRQAGVMESPFFRVSIDPERGTIRSLYHKPSGRELIDPSAAPSFGQHLYERFDADQVAVYVKSYVKITADWAVNELGKPSMPPAREVPYRARSPGRVNVRLEGGPLSASALIESGPEPGGLPYGVTTRLTIYSALDYVDLEMTIEGKPADPWPEAGWLCLPFKIAAPQFRLGRLGSIIDPAKDIVPGANRNLFGIHTGVAIFDADGRGVGLCPLDSPLVSLDEPGCWKYQPEFVPSRAVVYLNLFNNQWTTNFRLWNEGTWTSRVRLWAFDRYHAESSLITPSLEARYPLQAAFADGPGGSLPITCAGLSLSNKGVLVTAFGPNPDGPGLLLRLWESVGQSGSCRVQLPAGLNAKAVRPVDLRGRPAGEALELKEGAVDIALRPFAPLSLVIESRNPRFNHQ